MLRLQGFLSTLTLKVLCSAKVWSNLTALNLKSVIELQTKKHQFFIQLHNACGPAPTPPVLAEPGPGKGLNVWFMSQGAS